MARTLHYTALLLAAVALCLVASASCAGAGNPAAAGDSGTNAAASPAVAEAAVGVDGSVPGASGDAPATGDVKAQAAEANAVNAGDGAGAAGTSGGASGGTASDGEPASPETQAVKVLTDELAELERVLDLTHRKADVLRRLRTELLSGGKLPPQSTGFAARRASALGSGTVGGAALGGDTQESRVLSQYGDMQQSRGAGGRKGGRGFSDYFMQKANVTLPDGVKIEAAELISVRTRRPRGASRRSPLGAIFLVVAACDDGNFHFFDRTGASLLVVPTGHKAPITALAHDLTDVPAVFSAASDGTVRVATLNVWFDGKLIAGRLPANAVHGHAPLPEHNTIHKEVLQAATADQAKEALHIDPNFKPDDLGMSLHLSLFATWTAAEDVVEAIAAFDDDTVATLDPAAAAGEGAIVTSLAAYHYSTRRMIVAATNVGVVSVHLFNGTRLKAFHYTNTHTLARRTPGAEGLAPPKLPPPELDAAVTAMARYGAQIAFAVKGNVRFMNLIKPARTHSDVQLCEGPGSDIVAMAYDFVKPSGLWVGTASGDLLLFDTRAKLQTASTCKLMHRVASADGSPVSVASIRGYVASLSGAGIVEVHNTTDVDSAGVRWVLTHGLEHVFVPSGGDGVVPTIRTETVGGRMSSSTQTMVLVAAIGGSSLFLHESLLPYSPQHYDIAWIRGPLLAVAVAVVVGYQVLKRRGKAPGPSIEEIAKTLRVPGGDGSSFAASRGMFGGGGVGTHGMPGMGSLSGRSDGGMGRGMRNRR